MWISLDSCGLVWIRLDLFGFIGFLGFCWFILIFSLDIDWIQFGFGLDSDWISLQEGG